MTTPTSTQLNHAACNIASPVKLRRFKVFAPFQSCRSKAGCHYTFRQPVFLCQAEAAAVGKKSPGKPRTPGRPRSPGRPRKRTPEPDTSVADTGEPGKRVVIVGGGWAGKPTCMHLRTLIGLQADNLLVSMYSVYQQVLVQQSIFLYKGTQ